jgi:hypothetical protein
MPVRTDNAINFNGHTLFKILQGATYTVGTTVTAASPTNGASGVSPTTVFDARRQAVGGVIYAGFSDIAGPASPDDLHFKLNPGDVVACSAVVSSKITVTVNGESIAIIPATAVGGVLGYWS